MNPNLEINIQEPNIEKKYQLVSFKGDFDKAGHSDIREDLDKCVNDFDQKSLVFDFSELKFINSEGIGYLMEIHTHLVKNDMQLVIVGLNSHVNDVFKTIGIVEIIKVYKNIDEFLNQ